MIKNFLVVGMILFISCNASNSTDDDGSNDSTLDVLFHLMQGSYNSEAQSIADSNYYNISLHMYPIWEDRDGYYLYVEQALNAMQDKPYRQRIYEVTQLSEQTYSSAVYRLPDGTDSLWIGKWKSPEDFETLNLSDLVIREGCAVLLTKIGDNHFKGSTNEQDCVSTLRGAAYATSIVEVFQDRILSWDQGWDSTGVQVWGAEQGGYVFDRLMINN